MSMRRMPAARHKLANVWRSEWEFTDKQEAEKQAAAFTAENDIHLEVTELPAND